MPIGGGIAIGQAVEYGGGVSYNVMDAQGQPVASVAVSGACDFLHHLPPPPLLSSPLPWPVPLTPAGAFAASRLSVCALSPGSAPLP